MGKIPARISNRLACTTAFNFPFFSRFSHLNLPYAVDLDRGFNGDHFIVSGKINNKDVSFVLYSSRQADEIIKGGFLVVFEKLLINDVHVERALIKIDKLSSVSPSAPQPEPISSVPPGLNAFQKPLTALPPVTPPSDPSANEAMAEKNHTPSVKLSDITPISISGEMGRRAGALFKEEVELSDHISGIVLSKLNETINDPHYSQDDLFDMALSTSRSLVRSKNGQLLWLARLGFFSEDFASSLASKQYNDSIFEKFSLAISLTAKDYIDNKFTKNQVFLAVKKHVPLSFLKKLRLFYSGEQYRDIRISLSDCWYFAVYNPKAPKAAIDRAISSSRAMYKEFKKKKYSDIGITTADC